MILVVGLAQFIHFEPSGQHTGLAAKIVGVYDYDPKTRQTTGPNKDHFQTSEPFAAEVDWTSLPPDLVVGAQWFSGGFTIDAGGVGPARAASLSEHSVVPVNFGGARLPPGHYEFVVERYAGGRPVEVLARKTVVVVGHV
ncbi:MAG: hypothetical protein E6J29_13150 [Chloroflexi bacterium]|nr:MAG: hypothetical protein E6J29_13150 [Chloroflexota bacterium]TMD52402.1 MAG: hypothetical protein E6I85_10710 [Chloroflexota bacterium]